MQDLSILFARVYFGLMMLFAHGWLKLGMDPSTFPDPFGLGAVPSYWLAVFAEVACSAMVVVGLFTRLNAIPLIITMATAAFVIHGNDPFSKQEFALMYGAGFVVVFLSGGGKYSLQEVLGLSSIKPLARFLMK
ncbi:MAG: DoxX family protein [Bdellovibrionales bacterium]|nr:DoxX family protein [Bdellovibrionales bacterium]